MFLWWDPMYFVFIAPALVLMLWAQARVRSAYARGMKIDAQLSGAAAARYILEYMVTGFQRIRGAGWC